MKALLILLFMFFTHSAWSVCNTPISRSNFGSGQVPSSTKYNLDFNALYDRVNELPGDCFADSSLLTAAFDASAVTTAKIADATLTAAKFASGVIPDYGYPLRIKAYTSSGSWIKQADVGRIFVQVIGGGGAARSNFYLAPVVSSSASSFGTHCIGNGGGYSNTGTGASGGSAYNGHLNLSGGNGKNQTVKVCASNSANVTGCFASGEGGISMLGRYGQGGSYQYDLSNTYTPSGGGGAGGYCAKLIEKESLEDVVTVTVGSGGYATGINAARANPGQSGIVLVYEYSL